MKNAKFLKAGIVILVFLAITFGVFLVIQGYRNHKLNSQVNSQTTQAAEAKQSALNSNAQSVSSAIDRKTEDNRRAEIITPKVEAARKSSQISRSELEKAKGKYESEKSNSQNLNSSRAANCADLRRLFPDVRFEDCQ